MKLPWKHNREGTTLEELLVEETLVASHRLMLPRDERKPVVGTSRYSKWMRSLIVNRYF